MVVAASVPLMDTTLPPIGTPSEAAWESAFTLLTTAPPTSSRIAMPSTSSLITKVSCPSALALAEFVFL